MPCISHRVRGHVDRPVEGHRQRRRELDEPAQPHLGCGCGRRLVTGSCVIRETTQAGCPWSRPRVALSIYLSITSSTRPSASSSPTTTPSAPAALSACRSAWLWIWMWLGLGLGLGLASRLERVQVRLCRKQRARDFGQLAPRRLGPAPDHVSGCPELRPASATQPFGPRWSATQASLST